MQSNKEGFQSAFINSLPKEQADEINKVKLIKTNIKVDDPDGILALPTRKKHPKKKVSNQHRPNKNSNRPPKTEKKVWKPQISFKKKLRSRPVPKKTVPKKKMVTPQATKTTTTPKSNTTKPATKSLPVKQTSTPKNIIGPKSVKQNIQKQNTQKPSIQKQNIKGNIGKNDATCAIQSCKTKLGYSIYASYPFPADAERRELWIQMTGDEHFKPTKTSFVCGRHFPKYAFNPDTFELLESVVPSMNLPESVMMIEYLDTTPLDESALHNSHHIEKSIKRKKKGPSPSPVNHKRAKQIEDSTNAMNKFRELYTSQEILGLKVKQYKADYKRYSTLVDKYNQLKKSIAEKRKDDASTEDLFNILNGSQFVIKENEELEDEETLEMIPHSYSKDVEQFAAKLYNFNPDGYVYLRHAIMTLLPDVEYLKKLQQTGKVSVPKESVNVVKFNVETCKSSLNMKVTMN